MECQGIPILQTMPNLVRRGRQHASQMHEPSFSRQDETGSHAAIPLRTPIPPIRIAVSWGDQARRDTSSMHVATPGTRTNETGFKENNRKVRPSQFQKWVRKYDGSGDPYDHLASFKQVLRAKQVTDFHTQYEGFGSSKGKPYLGFKHWIQECTYDLSKWKKVL